MSETGEQYRVSTGSPVLDTILDGGLPPQRTTLLTGTPGTGKTTLAMQFLQEGLENGDRCLFISTEQSQAELRDSLSPFAFDLSHEDLLITSVHAAPGRTFESEDEELVLQTFEDGSLISEDYSAPFNERRIREWLEQYAPRDRVVLDSVSGLYPMSDDENAFRRGVLDLIHLFTEDFDATTIFTAEHTGSDERSGVETISPTDAIQYNAHGVIRVWREAIEGEWHRFLDIMKMRGVDHDTRQYEIGFDDSGVHIIPRKRAHSKGFIDHNQQPTGIDGLDALLGGGLLKGTGVLLEHDGQANFDALVMRIVGQAIESDMAIVGVPTVDLKKAKLNALIQSAGYEKTLDDLLDADRFFVLDMVGAWDDTHENVFDVQREDAGVKYLLQTINDRTDEESLLYVMNTEAKVHGIGEDDIRSLRYWQEANMIGPDDLLLDIHNPQLMSSDLAEFHVDAAGQVLRTWLGDSGLQYVKVKKSPMGYVGSSRVVEYIDEPPYVRVDPP